MLDYMFDTSGLHKKHLERLNVNSFSATWCKTSKTDIDLLGDVHIQIFSMFLDTEIVSTEIKQGKKKKKKSNLSHKTLV